MFPTASWILFCHRLTKHSISLDHRSSKCIWITEWKYYFFTKVPSIKISNYFHQVSGQYMAKKYEKINVIISLFQNCISFPSGKWLKNENIQEVLCIVRWRTFALCLVFGVYVARDGIHLHLDILHKCHKIPKKVSASSS